MLRILTLFLSFLLAIICNAEMSLDEAYKLGSSIAQSNKQKAIDGVKGFKPTDVFKNYNANPSQASYYQGVRQGDIQDLKNKGNAELNKANDKQNDSLGALKTASESYKKRPKLDIKVDDPNNPWMSKASNIMSNAPDIVTGRSNPETGLSCKESKVCNVVYSKKTCNEEARSIKRVCEKIPKVNVVIKDIIYPNCQSMVVTTGYHVGCPSGYSQILYSDMIKGPSWDDIRLCVKTMPNNEGHECFTGYLVQSVYHNSHTRRTMGPGRGVVPKNMHGRIKFSNVHDGRMVVTIVNETTSETLHKSGHFTNGQVVELPFSETRDQAFRFSIANTHYRGVMVLYIDHITKSRVADITWEEACNDV